MMDAFSVRLVKELKGAPLSVLIALMMAGGAPVNQEWLERNTGYTDKPVRQALAYLSEHGFARQVGRGWSLAEGAGPVFLEPARHIEPADPGPGAEAQEHRGQADHPGGADYSDANGRNRNNSECPIINTNKGFKDSHDSGSTNNGDRNNSGQNGGLELDGPGPGAPPGGSSPGSGRFDDFPRLGNALMDLGIRENHRTRRLLGRITARDVRAMAARIRDDPYHDLSETGLMVTILEGMAERKARRGGYESWNLEVSE